MTITRCPSRRRHNLKGRRGIKQKIVRKKEAKYFVNLIKKLIVKMITILFKHSMGKWYNNNREVRRSVE